MPLINKPDSQSFNAHIQLLSPNAAAKLLGISRNLLDNWRYRKIGPAYIKYPGGKLGPVRYREDVLVAFILDHEVMTARIAKAYPGPLRGVKRGPYKKAA